MWLFNACVSARIHDELKAKYNDLDERYAFVKTERDSLRDNLETARDQITALENNLSKLRKEKREAEELHETLLGKHKELNKNYEFLLESNNALLSSNQEENRKLMKKLNTLQQELQSREDSLRSERKKLDYLGQELQKREARVYELESLVSEQDQKVKAVRNRLKEALFNFDGKGLTVEQREGKVYVSLENSLLFPSGSWKVNSNGREALNQLAGVLAENPDLNVTVEGHTDSDPYNGRGEVSDNWDLSVMRATAIVKILTDNPGVDPKTITAAGRSEYLPIASNETREGKAQNRRTEIIITPDLSEIVKLLGEVN